MGLLAKTGQGARRLLTWPFILVPWREILAGGRSIRSQANDLWSRTRAEDRQQVIRDGDRLVDLRGFAQAHGLSEQEGRALAHLIHDVSIFTALFGWRDFKQADPFGEFAA